MSSESVTVPLCRVLKHLQNHFSQSYKAAAARCSKRRLELCLKSCIAVPVAKSSDPILHVRHGLLDCTTSLLSPCVSLVSRCHLTTQGGLALTCQLFGLKMFTVRSRRRGERNQRAGLEMFAGRSRAGTKGRVLRVPRWSREGPEEQLKGRGRAGPEHFKGSRGRALSYLQEGLEEEISKRSRKGGESGLEMFVGGFRGGTWEAPKEAGRPRIQLHALCT